MRTENILKKVNVKQQRAIRKSTHLKNLEYMNE